MSRLRTRIASLGKQLFAVPYIVWMAVFVIAPIILVVIYAFTTAGGSFTFDNFASMGSFTTVFTRSFLLALISTVICLGLGYPLAYILSRETKRLQKLMIMLIMLPMWMNFLLRTYAWMSILENTGLLNRFLGFLGKGVHAVGGSRLPPPALRLRKNSPP
jgi:spermidine/putrescine transport system permease protein